MVTPRPVIATSIALLITLLVAACFDGGSAGGSKPADAQAGSGPAAQGNLVHSDDFSSADDRWEVGDWEVGAAVIEVGEMFVRAATHSGSITSHFRESFTDTIVEVDVRLSGGTDNNWQTVVCRSDGAGSYYDLGISADGFYLIDVWVHGKKQAGSIGPLHAPVIRQGPGAVNTMRVECVGNRLQLSVNGMQLGSITDSSRYSGWIGFSVDSLDGEFSEAAYDNLRIYEAN